MRKNRLLFILAALSLLPLVSCGETITDSPVSTQEGSSEATGGSSSTNPTSYSSQETSSSSSRQEATEDLKFTLSSDKQSYAVSGYTGTSASVFIPETYEGLPVTSIGEYAIHGCIKLTGITLPGSLRNISANAFEWCTGITDVSLPASVTSIGYGAFSGCTGLTSFAVDPANAKFERDGKALYSKGKVKLLQYAPGLTDSLIRHRGYRYEHRPIRLLRVHGANERRAPDQA
jgi:hypothetical protein